MCYFENVLKFTLILATITECPAGLSHLFSGGAFALTPLRGRSPAGLHIITGMFEDFSIKEKKP